jgi:CHASE2 domain-containing sensor protein
MIFGHINIWTWLLVFFATLLYEYLTVISVIAIIKFRSITVANLSVGINAIGIGCILLYTQEVNTTIPLLAAVWVGNYYAVEHEKRANQKRAKEENSKNKS